MHVCVYIYIYTHHISVYIYIYIYMYIHVTISLFLSLSIYIYIYVHICILYYIILLLSLLLFLLRLLLLLLLLPLLLPHRAHTHRRAAGPRASQRGRRQRPPWRCRYEAGRRGKSLLGGVGSEYCTPDVAIANAIQKKTSDQIRECKTSDPSENATERSSGVQSFAPVGAIYIYIYIYIER